MTAIPPNRELLERRARALARPAAEPRRDGVELVTFALANETYAFESRYVLEVLRLSDVSRLPGAEPPIFGITTWRGGLLTILDIRPTLGLSETPLDDLTRLVVLAGGGTRAAYGVLVNQVHDVVAAAASEVRDVPAGVAAARDMIRGITGDAVVVLAADRLLALYT